MSQIFKPEHVGQQVSDPLLGNGVIIGYDSNEEFQVKVQFNSGKDTFTSDGCRVLGCLPTLQFGPLDNWERRTQPQLQDGQLIMVQVDDENWRIAMVKFKDGQPLIYSYVRDDGSPIYYESKNITWRCVL